MPYWDKREEELFKKAWMSNKYEEEDLADLFWSHSRVSTEKSGSIETSTKKIS